MVTVYPAIPTYFCNFFSIVSHSSLFWRCEIVSIEGTTQEYHITIAIYAVAVIPLLLMVLTVTYPDSAVNMAAYDKDFTAGRILADLNPSWETLCKLDPKSGYYPEAANYWFIFKGDFKDKVDNTFRD